MARVPDAPAPELRQLGRHSWWWCAIRSMDRPALGRCPRCCRCVDRCDHPDLVVLEVAS